MQTRPPLLNSKKNQSCADYKSPASVRPQFEDARADTITQLRLQSLMENSAQATQLKSMQAMMAANPSSAKPIQRLEKIKDKNTFDNLGDLEIDFKEPSKFFGGLEGFVKFTPVEGGEQAQLIDLVQTASMKYAEHPNRMEWVKTPKKDGEGFDFTPIKDSDGRAGENVSTSGGSVIKDAMRTGRTSDARMSPDFHIDKVYDTPGTRPGESKNSIVRDPAYNADRRQVEGGSHELGKLGNNKPRTLPGINWKGSIEPTTLIDTPRSINNPVSAEFETVVRADRKSWASVEWGFTTEYSALDDGNEVKSTYARMDKSATKVFHKALRNYEDIVRANDTSDAKLQWLQSNPKDKSYAEEHEISSEAFAWALNRLSASLEKTKAKDSDVSDQQETARLYLFDMIAAAKKFSLLPQPREPKPGLKESLAEAIRHALDV